MKNMNAMAAVDPEEVFPQVENIIYQLAHRFSKAYPISFDECLSEGYWAFMEACGRWDPKRKAKLSSFVYFITWCKLKNLVIKRSKEPLEFVEIKEEMLGEAPLDKSRVMELIEDLSEDAKEIVGLLIETPGELVGVEMTPKQFFKKVKDYMLQPESPHWLTKRDVRKAQKELRNRFQRYDI